MYLQVWPSEERNQWRRNSINIIIELTFLWLKSHLELNSKNFIAVIQEHWNLELYLSNRHNIRISQFELTNSSLPVNN